MKNRTLLGQTPFLTHFSVIYSVNSPFHPPKVTTYFLENKKISLLKKASVNGEIHGEKSKHQE